MNLLALPLLVLPALQEPVEKSGPHFRVVSHVPIEALAAEALEAAEAVWPLAVEALGVQEQKPEGLTIHLYPDAKSYEEAEAALTKGAFKANLSFSHFATKSTHVALQPPCADEVLQALGLPTLTRYLVAHEAMHLVAYAHLPNALDLPEWFAEGAATHVGFQALQKLGRIRAQAEEPLAAKSLLRCREMLDKETLPTAGAILSGGLGGLELHPRYSVYHEFYAFLQTESPKELARAVAELRSTGGGSGSAVTASLRKIWPEKDLKKLSKSFEDFLSKQEPSWDEVLRSLETRGGGYVQRAFADANALAFRVDDPLDKLPATISGTLRFWPGASQQMNFLLGRSEQGFLSIAFSVGEGVTVFRCDYGQPDKWTRLVYGASPDMQAGVDLPFAIVVEKQELTISVAGKEVARAALAGRSPLGAWGLGAQAGATGEWKDVTVKAGR